MNPVHFSSKTDDWATPTEFFKKIDSEFHFTLDVCASKENAKCAKFFCKDDDDLSQDWGENFCWMNPPYGREIGKWIEKAAGFNVVALLPARTDTKWFHKYIYGKAEIRFVSGRLKFGDSKNSAPFPSMVVIWRKPNCVIFGYD